MSAGFMTSEREWSATRKVGLLARDLYDALRRRMDFKTGIVGGTERAVSWWALREDLEVPGRPGVKRFLPSEQSLRRCMHQLEKVGLIASIGDKLRLCFRLLLAKTDKHDPKNAGGGAIAHPASRKAASRKAKQACAQGNSVEEAGTHQNTGNFSTHPNPSHACGAEGANVQPPTPAAREGGEDPRQTHANGIELSEQRHESGCAVGERQHSDGGQEPTIRWQQHLAWPQGLIPEHRAQIARKLAGLCHDDQQRVLDELQGMSEVTTIRSWWRALSFMIGKAKGVGWTPVHADRVRLRRARLRAELIAAERAACESTQRTAMPAGWVGQMKDMIDARWRSNGNS